MAAEGSFTIRRAGESDYDAMRRHFAMTQDAHAAQMPELFRPTREHDFPVGHFNAYVNDDNSLLLIAELDAVVAGSLHASVRQTDGYYSFAASRSVAISSVATEPYARRRGIARALIAAAAEWAVEKEADRIDLTVWAFNADAFALYRKLGFADAYAGLMIKPGDAIARLGTGRLPKPQPKPVPWWLAWRR